MGGRYVLVPFRHAHDRAESSEGGVIKRRLIKVAAPYLVWSAIYLVALHPDTSLGVIKALLTGGASAQMYYLPVYAQLVVLTPLLLKLLKTHRVALYAVTPIMLVAWETFALLELNVPRLGWLFPMWLLYYLVGLEWGRWRDFLKDRRRLVAVAAVVGLSSQVAEGFLWNSFGDYGMATSQLRITNMVSSVAVISLFMVGSEAVKGRLAACGPLVRLGDLSFGIYLCHMVFVMALSRVVSMAGIACVASSFAIWAIVLILSALFVAACQRILPKRLLSVLGFA